MCESSEAQEDMVGQLVEDGDDMCWVAGDTYGVRYTHERFGSLGLKTIGGRFHSFVP